jgi:hypothetical protein
MGNDGGWESILSMVFQSPYSNIHYPSPFIRSSPMPSEQSTVREVEELV